MTVSPTYWKSAKRSKIGHSIYSVSCLIICQGNELLYELSEQYACPKGTIYQDLFIYMRIYLYIARYIYIHQDLFIYVKIHISMLRLVYIKIHVHRDCDRLI